MSPAAPQSILLIGLASRPATETERVFIPEIGLVYSPGSQGHQRVPQGDLWVQAGSLISILPCVRNGQGVCTSG